MPHIGKDGTIYEGSGPLQVRVVNFFWGIVNAFVAFFQTLIPGFGEETPAERNGTTGSMRAPPRSGSTRRNVRGFGSVSSWQPPPCGGGS